MEKIDSALIFEFRNAFTSIEGLLKRNLPQNTSLESNLLDFKVAVTAEKGEFTGDVLVISRKISDEKPKGKLLSLGGYCSWVLQYKLNPCIRKVHDELGGSPFLTDPLFFTILSCQAMHYTGLVLVQKSFRNMAYDEAKKMIRAANQTKNQADTTRRTKGTKRTKRWNTRRRVNWYVQRDAPKESLDYKQAYAIGAKIGSMVFLGHQDTKLLEVMTAKNLDDFYKLGAVPEELTDSYLKPCSRQS